MVLCFLRNATLQTELQILGQIRVKARANLKNIACFIGGSKWLENSPLVYFIVPHNTNRNDLRSTGIIFWPGGNELSQVMRAQDGGVSGQVVEVVHDDGDEEVEHDEWTQEDEGHEVDVGQGRAAVLSRVEKFTWKEGLKFFVHP